MSNQPLDLEKLIDFSVDYYVVLGLNKEQVPQGKDQNERQELIEIFEKAYRRSAFKAHPDHPQGSEEAFRLVVHAHTILADPIARRYYDSGGTEKPVYVGDGHAENLEIDWDSLGTYRQGTRADAVGYGLFMQICQQKTELNLITAFHPTDPTHSYEWDWVLPDKEVKLALSLVHDAREVLRLTSGEDIMEALPFKIYICIPRASVYFLRESQEEHVQPDGTVDVLNGKLLAATYSDYNFLETTSLEIARHYISPEGKLAADLAAFRDGTMIRQQAEQDLKAAQNQWINREQMKALDTDILRSVLLSKTHRLVKDESAADFLDNIPGEK